MFFSARFNSRLFFIPLLVLFFVSPASAAISVFCFCLCNMRHKNKMNIIIIMYCQFHSFIFIFRLILFVFLKCCFCFESCHLPLIFSCSISFSIFVFLLLSTVPFSFLYMNLLEDSVLLVRISSFYDTFPAFILSPHFSVRFGFVFNHHTPQIFHLPLPLLLPLPWHSGCISKI